MPPDTHLRDVLERLRVEIELIATRLRMVGSVLRSMKELAKANEQQNPF